MVIFSCFSAVVSWVDIMGLLSRLKGFLGFGSSREQVQQEQQGMLPIVVVPSTDFIEVTVVPPNRIPYIWSLIEKDAALSYLDDKEFGFLQIKVDIIAELSTVFQPEVYHPEILNMLYNSMRNWIDRENIELFGYLRLKRSFRGLERRFSTITGYRYVR